MNKSKWVTRLMVLATVLVGSYVVVPSTAEAYTYLTRDWQVVGKKCRFGNSGCYNVYGWRINSHYVPDTLVSRLNYTVGNPSAALSAADSTGSTATCLRSGSKCVTNTTTTQVKTTVPTLDVAGSGPTIQRIAGTAVKLPVR